MSKYTITITREFGSLGRPIAHALSQKLGIEYYDRDIVDEVAKQLNLPVSQISDAANNDTTGLSCQIQDNILLDIKDHILYVFLVCTKGKHVGKEMIVGAFFRITDLGYREV